MSLYEGRLAILLVLFHDDSNSLYHYTKMHTIFKNLHNKDHKYLHPFMHVSAIQDDISAKTVPI